MAELIAINPASSQTDIARATHIARAVEAIHAGHVIVAPLDHSYVFLVDAFNAEAVEKMHLLRGDARGISSQVLVGSLSKAEDLVENFSPQARALARKFWPGSLSLNLQPRVDMPWDLGDSKSLGEISIRIPSSKFVLSLLQETRPLAVSSAAPSGQPTINSVDMILEKEIQVAIIFDAGRLRMGQLTSVVSCIQQETRLLREGAISMARIKSIVPEIQVTN
jgi:tRNA threonylcarbamoyl adenosine modification protein (Sua5/YciO/YrdC/YwlC family)